MVVSPSFLSSAWKPFPLSPSCVSWPWVKVNLVSRMLDSTVNPLPGLRAAVTRKVSRPSCSVSSGVITLTV